MKNMFGHALRLACAAAATSAMASAGATGYTITPVSGPLTYTQLFDINNSGDIVGQSFDTTNSVAFVLHDGSFTTVSGPSSSLGTTAYGISDNGVIVGSYFTAYVTDPGSGQQVAGPSYGFIQDGSSITTINPAGATSSELRGISPDGRYVAGWYSTDAGLGVGFVFDRTTSSYITVSQPDSLFTIMQGINANGIAVGNDQRAGASRVGITYDIASGARTEYAVPGYRTTTFRDINASGLMTGFVQDGGSGLFAIIGRPGAFDVISLDPNAITFGEGINDAGWVVGDYTIGDASYGFLARPVPEPASAVMLAAGLVGLLAARRRR